MIPTMHYLQKFVELGGRPNGTIIIQAGTSDLKHGRLVAVDSRIIWVVAIRLDLLRTSIRLSLSISSMSRLCPPDIVGWRSWSNYLQNLLNKGHVAAH